ncbi:M15 family metallopeptidase [Herbiconiux daphne]|uniref:M15 family metallopeptidase n=1 Tax=Herbiconiux daphne TaxID=2970914 RepID=A0ABT2GY73_9MICO|nr:M15 family metallopeptidase [Herbiconiux daphne]MCS5732906.1 M15 family metallopeptidase [Herbiconiux daphne]
MPFRPLSHPLSVALGAAALLAVSGCASAAALTSSQGVVEPARPSFAGDSDDTGGGSGDDFGDGSGGDPARPLGPDDGYIPDGDTVALTDDVPAVTRLDPALRAALTSAEAAAAADGDGDVRFTLVDGWRSDRYQQFLFDRAVDRYGDADEAARWVKTPAESKHVSGQAVDIATADAMDWLNRFGAPFGLCQVYANEAWHFELAAVDGRPDQLPDAAG